MDLQSAWVMMGKWHWFGSWWRSSWHGEWGRSCIGVDSKIGSLWGWRLVSTMSWRGLGVFRKVIDGGLLRRLMDPRRGYGNFPWGSVWDGEGQDSRWWWEKGGRGLEVDGRSSGDGDHGIAVCVWEGLFSLFIIPRLLSGADVCLTVRFLNGI